MYIYIYVCVCIIYIYIYIYIYISSCIYVYRDYIFQNLTQLNSAFAVRHVTRIAFAEARGGSEAVLIRLDLVISMEYP